jgi:NAD(P)-dependent dehydrogenase (short-subunit alcohol dehydrogenase family)
MRQGKAIFITGGGSGIGRAVARLFAANGWFVGLADINQDSLAQTAAGLPSDASSTHPLDVRDRERWDEALAEFAERTGRIDVVFNNAGIATGGPVATNTRDEIDQLIDVNFRGVAYGAQAAYPFLKAAAPASCLLNTASAAAIYGAGNLAIYSATKFAVRALTEALDAEWTDDGIRVRSIMPGFIDTPLLHGSIGVNSNVGKRDAVLAMGLEFTPVERVAQAAWAAVHGERLHTLVGPTARKMHFASKWMPKFMRREARRLARPPQTKGAT